jgi:hypothetical protein
MRRRDLIAMTAAMAGTAIARPLVAQPSLVRAAVVIGVNKAGNLPVLNAAASGAKQVGDWLDKEGFSVKRFTDDQGPVKASDLFDAISALVDKGTLDQLVVYFSGHGFLNAYTEYWMLSNAPQNPNEAVSVTESVTLAKESAIPNVVFISDACRSTPESIGTNRVRGSLIFPNSAVSGNVRPNIDIFYAALPGSPAAEVPVGQSAPNFEGLFTSCFLSAFQSPIESMVRTVNGVRVVPNRNLKVYLEGEVTKRAEAKAIRLHQKPDASITSDDTAYIGRAADLQVGSASPPPSGITLRDVLGQQLKIAGAGEVVSARVGTPINPVEAANATTAFANVQKNILEATVTAQKAISFSPSLGGLVVSGAQVAEIEGGPNAKAQLLGGDPATAQIQFLGVPAASVVLRFGNGSGTVVAALRGFICSVVVDEFGVSSVNYIGIGQGRDERIERLHAAVAAAAQFGVFRIDGEAGTLSNRAASFGDRIRVGKGTDPSLGLYAAYAYAQAGLIEQVRSVGSFMRDSLQIDLFDIAMLGRQLSKPGAMDSKRVFPFCPMLAQGWNFLRVLQVDIAPGIDKARDHLRRGLWTTFDSEGVAIMTDLLRSGKVQ